MAISALFLTLLVSITYVDARNFLFNPQEDFVGSSIFSWEKLSPGFLCNSCLEISREVEKFLSDPELPEEVGEIYNHACHILPSDLQDKCVEMLETYANEAILFLQKSFTEQKLCNSTGLCSVDSGNVASSFGSDEKLSVSESSDDIIFADRRTSSLQTELQVPKAMLQRFISQVSDDRSCAACHAAMDELNDDLENPETKIKMIKVLLKACERVENHVKQCKRMVLEYSPIILSDLEKYMKNNDPCLVLHICEANTMLSTENIIPLLRLSTDQLTQALKSSE